MDLYRIFNRNKVVIFVIDVQNDFCSDDGLFSKLGRDVTLIQHAAQHIQKLINIVRKIGIEIIYIKSDYGNDKISEALRAKLDGRYLELCTTEQGKDFYKIRPKNGEKVIVKNTHDPFTNPELKQFLDEHDIDTIIVTGFTTNTCIETTVRRALSEGYFVIIPKECTATVRENLQQHYYSLERIGSYFGYVVSYADILNRDTIVVKDEV